MKYIANEVKASGAGINEIRTTITRVEMTPIINLAIFFPILPSSGIEPTVFLSR